jgi:hypothetical protein
VRNRAYRYLPNSEGALHESKGRNVTAALYPQQAQGGREHDVDG